MNRVYDHIDVHNESKMQGILSENCDQVGHNTFYLYEKRRQSMQPQTLVYRKTNSDLCEKAH